MADLRYEYELDQAAASVEAAFWYNRGMTDGMNFGREIKRTRRVFDWVLAGVLGFVLGVIFAGVAIATR